MQERDDPRLRFAHVRRQDDGAQRRRDGKRRDQAAGQCIGVSTRHRAEDVALHAAQREQRQEGGDDDGCSKEDRAGDVGGRAIDRVALHAHHGFGRDRSLFVGRQRGGLRQPPENRLDHDHGGVDNQTEVDGADRQQVGGLPAQHQDNDGKEQRERNCRPDDDGAAQIAEENPLQQDDQQNAHHHVVQHGVGRGFDQVLAIVDPLDSHAGRQDAGAVDRIHKLLDPRNGRRALFATAHQHDALDDVVVAVLAGDTKPRLFPDRHRRDVLDQHRIAAALGDHGVGEIVDRADQPDAAHHGRLAADIDGVAADVDVGIADRLQQLRQGQPIGDQLVEIDLNLIGLGLAAPAGDVDHAGDRTEAALQHPVLQRLQVHHAVVGRPHQPVAEDFTDGAERGNLRLHVAGQRPQLAQAVEHLLQGFIIGVVERELQFDVGQAVQRNGADGAQVLDAGELRLDRNGDVALDLLGRQTRALGHDVDHRRGRIRIGLDVQLLERDQSPDEHRRKKAEHQEAATDRQGNDTIHSGRIFPRRGRMSHARRNVLPCSSELAARRSPVNEQAAFGHDLLVGRKAVLDLDQIAVGEADLDAAQLDRFVVAHHPDPNLIALVDQRLFRHADGRSVAAGIDRHIGEHFRLQRRIRIVHGGAHQQPAAGRINRRRDVVDAGLVGTPGGRQHREGKFLADADRGDFGLAHIGRQPHRRQVTDHEHRIGGARVDVLARSDLALHDGPGDRRIDFGLRIDPAFILEGGDRLVVETQNPQPVARRFQRSLSRMHIVLRPDQRRLRLLIILQGRRLAFEQVLGALVLKLRQFELRLGLVHGSDRRDEIILALHGVGRFDDQQRLPLHHLVSGPRQQLGDPAGIGREHGSRTVLINRDLALGHVLGPEHTLAAGLDREARPFGGARRIAHQAALARLARDFQLGMLRVGGHAHQPGNRDCAEHEQTRADGQPLSVQAFQLVANPQYEQTLIWHGSVSRSPSSLRRISPLIVPN